MSGKGRGEGASHSAPWAVEPPHRDRSEGASHAAVGPERGEGASHSAKGKSKTKGNKSLKGGKGASHPEPEKEVKLKSTVSAYSRVETRLKIVAGAVPQRSRSTNVYLEKGEFAHGPRLKLREH